ncbi:hypothetical protein JWG44_20695 [Leptospira sp. 201903071]|uniref:hypothetical protein n=1 Tax=Leptospira ainazelensis TaxID=2810034 RepID=UPI001964ACAF|nr:hypothetical protein [Leptospira ainazelensis]MBM9502677.1 hypothetical protein [Leptospira ainazelensis]
MYFLIFNILIAQSSKNSQTGAEIIERSNQFIEQLSYPMRERDLKPDGDIGKTFEDLKKDSETFLKEANSDKSAFKEVEKVKTKLQQIKAEYIRKREQIASEEYNFKPRFGISPGIMYLSGQGRGEYISGASVDSFGFIVANEKLRNITRLFPTVTGYWSPERVSPFFLGVTVGLNEGKNSGLGYSLAYGFTLGVVLSGNVHFGVFYGQIFDPSVRKLPSYLHLSQPYPSYLLGPEAKASYQYAGFSVPTEAVNGIYNAFGIVISISVGK